MKDFLFRTLRNKNQRAIYMDAIKSISSNSDFSLVIDFNKDSPDPSRIFNTMSSLIKTFETLDRDLVKQIDGRLETSLLLNDITTGSLKVFLYNILKNSNDEDIKKLDVKAIIGKYLVKVKYIILARLEKCDEIKNAKEIEAIEAEIVAAATETGVDKIPMYISVSKKTIVKTISNISSSIKYLEAGDKVYYESDYGKASFNADFSTSEEKLEELIMGDSYEVTMKMILKVKKPDYLGKSMWEFRHGENTITAKITDLNWLKSFQNRDIDVRPQDSLTCMVKTINKYGYDFEPISVTHEVLEVVKINPRTNNIQTLLNM